MRLTHILLLIFISVPIIEIYLLISVGRVIGVWWTIGLIITTAVVGVWLLRLQGYGALQRAQRSLEAGEIPTDSLMEGLFLLVAGLLLITPGFFTDTLGFLCLVPPLRLYLARRAFAHVMLKSAGRPHAENTPRRPSVLEGEYRREE